MLVADFQRYILPEVIGCPDPLLTQNILLAAYEFCDKSGAWNEVQDEVQITAGVSQYDIECPSQSMPLRIRDLWINDQRIEPERMRSLPELTLGAPVSFNSAHDFGLLTLSPAPSTDMRLRMRVVYAPTKTASSLPDALVNRYIEVIAAGAKSKLMAMPKVDWSNPGLGGFYRTQFEQGIHEAQIETIHDRVSGSLSIVPRRFA